MNRKQRNELKRSTWQKGTPCYKSTYVCIRRASRVNDNRKAARMRAILRHGMMQMAQFKIAKYPKKIRPIFAKLKRNLRAISRMTAKYEKTWCRGELE